MSEKRKNKATIEMSEEWTECDVCHESEVVVWDFSTGAVGKEQSLCYECLVDAQLTIAAELNNFNRFLEEDGEHVCDDCKEREEREEGGDGN